MDEFFDEIDNKFSNKKSDNNAYHEVSFNN